MRQPRPDAKAAAVGQRMRQLRIYYGLSQRTVAKQIGLSRDQLNRIERGLVSPRFSPTWTFCEFTGANPLWLAFGEPYGRLGFAAAETSDIPAAKPFFVTMRAMERDYVDYRSRVLNVPGPPRLSLASSPPKAESLAHRGVKQDLILEMPVRTFTWENLRSRLNAATKSPGAKAALAHHFNVSAAAVSQWLSGASAPTADTTLRLLEWVTAEEEQTKQKKRGD
jgi:transcriptional regulator with XRE-family HTH domain